MNTVCELFGKETEIKKPVWDENPLVSKADNFLQKIVSLLNY